MMWRYRRLLFPQPFAYRVAIIEFANNFDIFKLSRFALISICLLTTDLIYIYKGTQFELIPQIEFRWRFSLRLEVKFVFKKLSITLNVYGVFGYLYSIFMEYITYSKISDNLEAVEALDSISLLILITTNFYVPTLLQHCASSGRCWQPVFRHCFFKYCTTVKFSKSANGPLRSPCGMCRFNKILYNVHYHKRHKTFYIFFQQKP